MTEDLPTNDDNKAEWTIMVYLAGDNNLTANCIGVLQQLEQVKYSKDVRVLACFDSNTPWPKGSRYLEINRRRLKIDNGMDWEIHNDLVPPNDRGHALVTPDFCSGALDTEKHPEVRQEVAKGLSRFLEWAMKTRGRESRRYMLVLYGHGPIVAGRTFLARENPPSSLQLAELQKVLSEHFDGDNKLDILACQNCVMNGVETAYELRNQVELIIGSQGLVLAAGWPYQKIVSEIIDAPYATTKDTAVMLLKACARNLIDFAVMDRASEQSINDLTVLKGDEKNILVAVKELVNVLHEGLAFDQGDKEKDPSLLYPVICDAVKLARLEAQSYWGEMFVDLYDFCERLLKKCNEATILLNKLIAGLWDQKQSNEKLRETDLLKLQKKIAGCCINIMEAVKNMVPESYYIGSDLQYSRGLSIFFPWSLPTTPYYFVRQLKGDVELKTAFEAYRDYSFVQDSGWGDFLRDFFSATLRKVRRGDRVFSLQADNVSLDSGLVEELPRNVPLELQAIDLQKSSSDTGAVDYEVWSSIKNYPRRNYLSPSDCRRRVLEAGKEASVIVGKKVSPPVSYLGWNISGLVGQVIARKPNDDGNADSASPEIQSKGPSEPAV